jgi:hypothetical protein
MSARDDRRRENKKEMEIHTRIALYFSRYIKDDGTNFHGS